MTTMMRIVPERSVAVRWVLPCVGPLLATAWLPLAGCGNSAASADDDGRDQTASDGDAGAFDGEHPDVLRDGTDGGWDRPDIVVPPTCGDGILDPGEECDDGNRLNGDECDWACRLGPGEPPRRDPDDEVAGADHLSVIITEADVDLGEMGPAMAISGHREPLVWTGSHYATVALVEDWDEAATASSDLRFVRFDRDGVRFGPGWTLHEPERPFELTDLVWNGEGFGLIWTNEADSTVWFVELDADGKPIFSPVALVAGVPARDVSLVWLDGSYGAFWTEAAGSDAPRDAVAFVPFDRHGRRTAETIEILRRVDAIVEYAIDSASSGSTAVVVFLASGAAGCTDGGTFCVYSATVATDGRIVSAPMPIGPAEFRVAAIGWDGDSSFGLIWRRPLFDPSLHFARLGREGVLLGPPQPVGEPVADPMSPFAKILPERASIAFGAGGWGIAFPQAPGNPICRRNAGVVRTDRFGTLTDLVCHDATLVGTAAFGDVAFDGEAFGWLHNFRGALRLIRWVVGP
jgi:cysteine-rich repeat protein